MRMRTNILVAVTVLSLLIIAGQVRAETPEAEEGYVYPTLKPEFSFSAGYRFVNHNGADQAQEYEYLHNSVALGTELRFFSFPHRFHMDIEALNAKDYFGDINYAYEDIVLFRSINRGVYHNLENIRLIDLDPATSSPGVLVRDEGVRYGTRINMNNVFLRLKTPDFPFHVYIDGSYYVRDGVQQQRGLLNARGTSSVVRTSEARDVDWTTKAVTVGANSHLGPVEVDISHSEKRFDAGGNNVFYDIYPAVPSVRATAEYPRDLIPDQKGSSNTLKLHTSYTGSLVASATLTKMDRENRFSGAGADYFIGAGELTWTASPRLFFFLKYRHKEIDIDTPETVTISNRLNPAERYTYAVAPAVDSITDRVDAIVKYRPTSNLSLRAEYNFENINRNHAETVPTYDSTQKNTMVFSGDLKLGKGVFIKGKYTHRDITDPAYNTDPDRSDEGLIAVSWIPLPRLSTQISYNITRETRSDIWFLEPNGAFTRGEKRNATRDRLLGSLTYVLLKDLSVTGSYAYLHNKVQQDIAYHDISYAPQIDPFVPYKDMVHVYGLDLSYTPSGRVTVTGGITHTISSGAFYPNSTDLLQPVSVASFTQLKTHETVVSVNGEYRFNKGFSASAHYRYSDFKDMLNNPYDDVQSGRAHIVLLTISKKW